MIEDDKDTIFDKTIYEAKKSPISLLYILWTVVLGVATILGGIVAWKQLTSSQLQGQEKAVIYLQKEEAYSEPSRSNSIKDAQIESPAKTPEVKRPTRDQPAEDAPSNQYEEKRKSAATDYTSFLNTNFKNSPATTEVAITITDKSGNVLNSEAHSIARVYNQTGSKGFVGLFRSSFIKRSEYQELKEGNSDILENLGLHYYADFIALGTINYSFRNGTLVDGTVVCTVTVQMSILSTSTQSIVQDFSISNINGNGATEDQAKENAFQKVLNTYYNQYSAL